MTLVIKDLYLQEIIGILDFERARKQAILISSKIKYDYNECKYAQGFLSYEDIVLDIANAISIKKYFSIEECINDLFCILFNKYESIIKITLKVCKPDILQDLEGIKSVKVGVKKSLNKKEFFAINSFN